MINPGAPGEHVGPGGPVDELPEGDHLVGLEPVGHLERALENEEFRDSPPTFINKARMYLNDGVHMLLS